MAVSRVSGIGKLQADDAGHAIERVPTGVAAFVGRTLKGPVNRAVRVASFNDFQQLFGGLWQPSALSYAIEQFFENGGRSAYIVRVVNGARPPSLTLPTAQGPLCLMALNPGSREYLRASVDYDGIPDGEPDRFNLVLQRLRTAGSEQIEDQEIFRRVSVRQDSGRFITDVLRDSRLARVSQAVPSERPQRTLSAPGSALVGYIGSNADGDDGAPILDYDIIGSASAGSGMFALQAVPAFNFLCIPPLTREQDVGLSTLLIAARLCADHQAMLIVDPPAAWNSPRVALKALKSWPFRSENALMYFPRVVAFDRLRGKPEVFASCGAAAGWIARTDETSPVWTATESEDAVLRPCLRPAFVLTDLERMRLAQVGVNSLLANRASAPALVSPRTFTAGSSGATDWQYLSARRLALFITASIERGTRWLAFDHGPSAWARAQAQVESFLAALAREGAFAGAEPEESYFVICDERVNAPHSLKAGKVKVLFGFAIAKPCDFHAFLVTYQGGASRCRPVSPARQATAPNRLEWEIETAVLKGTSIAM